MKAQQNVPKIVNIMKKIIWAILIGLGIIIILYILAMVYYSFQGSKVTTSDYYGDGMAMGFAEDSGFSLPNFGFETNTPKIARDEASAPPIPTSAGNTSVSSEQKIIKTGSLDITVEDVEQTVNKISTEISALDGYVQNSTISEGRNGQKSANLIVRVPVSSFENIISKIKNLSKIVTRENVNGREVTEEFVDLQATLIHNQAVEQQYLELLKRAQKVEEIIAVREKLDQVQGEIERLKGRIRYLDNQTDLSTININITSEVKITLPADKWQPWEVVKSSTRDLIINLQNFINFFISLIFVLVALIPYALLILIIYIISRLIYKKYKRQK